MARKKRKLAYFHLCQKMGLQIWAYSNGPQAHSLISSGRWSAPSPARRKNIIDTGIRSSEIQYRFLKLQLRHMKIMRPIRLPEPLVGISASPATFGRVITRAVVIGNGVAGAENQCVGLVRALGLSGRHSLYVSPSISIFSSFLSRES